MQPILRSDECPHCGRAIVWGTLQNGRARSFEPQPRPFAEVPPAEAFAYSRRAGAIVCLDAEPAPPSQALVAHYCAEYKEARQMRNLTRLDAEIHGGLRKGSEV